VTFEELLQQAIAMLQRQGRVSYRAFKRQFALDDDYFADLKEAMLYAYPRWLMMQVEVWCGRNSNPPARSSRAASRPYSRLNFPSRPVLGRGG
jgi:hypothetical protein